MSQDSGDRKEVQAALRDHAQAARLHDVVRRWTCLGCGRPLVEHKQWFWCSASCREKSLERERGRNDTPADTGSLFGPDNES
jgi:hypothetical protein